MKLDDFKFLANSALGSITFGAYHMYITTNMINENDRNNQLIDENNRNNQLIIEEINRNDQLRWDELYIRIEKLEEMKLK